jgi:hypothetical protein
MNHIRDKLPDMKARLNGVKRSKPVMRPFTVTLTRLVLPTQPHLSFSLIV